MFPAENDGLQIHEVIVKNNSGIIVLPSNPNNDAIAAATALYLGLTKLGKNVSLVCSQPVKSDLIAADKVKNSLSAEGDNLIISFPYVEGSIDKVDYNISGDTFNLIITPRPGQPKLETNKVNYSYSGGVIQFIITIDVPNLNSIGHLYTEHQNDFEGKSIINIDRHLINDMYGTVNIVDKTSSSTSELVLQALQDLECEVDKDMASNLLSGIMSATNNYSSYSVNANTFESAAALMRLGAVKKPAQGMPQNKPFNPFKQPIVQKPPVNTQRPSMSEDRNTTPIESIEDDPDIDDDLTHEEWLKPKIFRGGGGLV
ncbi:hypothetical protein HGB07_01845 [Candidatus Roizmanbacteria bacterium]|nr:hypothetical protein [Candidatus Roizmanbacteria bacterium]